MSNRLTKLLQEALTLLPEEQMVLIARVAEHHRVTFDNRPSSGPWSGLRGMARSSLFGEDAQAYVSRTRQEADQCRAGARCSNM